MDENEKKLLIDPNVPDCPCFNTDAVITAVRCSDTATAANEMAAAFQHVAAEHGLCVSALPYFLEIATISMLTLIAKTQGPALEFGSKEIEWEVERLLSGHEARVLERSRSIHKRARDVGLTEEKVMAMREAAQNGGLQ